MADTKKKGFRTVSNQDKMEYQRQLQEHRMNVLKRIVIATVAVLLFVGGTALYMSLRLYEDYDDTIKKISECEVGNDTTLENYLKNVSIKVDNYSTICKDFKKMNLYLEINASDDSTMDYNHKIPLEVKSDWLFHDLFTEHEMNTIGGERLFIKNFM